MTTKTLPKWFQPLQDEAEQKIAALYDTSGNINFSEVGHDIAIEGWPVIRKTDKVGTNIVVTMHRQTGFIYIYEDVQFIEQVDRSHSPIAAAYIADGYKPRYNRIDAESLAECPCDKCGEAQRYIGLKNGTSYVAIGHCNNCGEESEF